MRRDCRRWVLVALRRPELVTTLPPRDHRSPGDAGTGLALLCHDQVLCIVDDSGNAFVYNGKTWSAPIQPPNQPGQTYPTAFVSISCPTAAFCVATDGTQAWTLS